LATSQHGDPADDGDQHERCGDQQLLDPLLILKRKRERQPKVHELSFAHAMPCREREPSF
jgi:hypothetical protein